MFDFVPYQQCDQKRWDDFVDQAKNATFLFRRDYMDYHADRFPDASYFVYEKGKIVALLPGNRRDHIYYSHQGLSYGGFLVLDAMKGAQLLHVFEAFRELLCAQEVEEWVYKPIPYIYSQQPAQEDLYALFRLGAQRVSCQLSSTIQYPQKLSWSSPRKRQRAAAQKEGLRMTESHHFAPFWEILTRNLSQKHHTKPTHSCAEIERLHALFPQEIRLFEVHSPSSELLGACVVFESRQVAHVQYISANEEGRRRGALDFLFGELIDKTYAHKAFFDFGHSCETQGHFLNEGLLFQKEGFGARGVVYETYIIPCRSHVSQ